MRPAFPVYCLLGSLLLVAESSQAEEKLKLIFDPLTGQMRPASEVSLGPQQETLLYRLIGNKVAFGEIEILNKDGENYIGLSALSYLLDFPIQVNAEQKTASGSFIKPSNVFQLRPSPTDKTILQLQVGEDTYELYEEDYLIEQLDIWLKANDLFQWLGLKFEDNKADLLLKIKAQPPLPVEQRLLRKQTKRQASQVVDDSISYPRQDVPYQLFAPVFVDLNLQLTDTNATPVSQSYSAVGRGDLLYMTGNYFIAGTQEKPLSSFRLNLSRERSEPTQGLTPTKITIGDVSSVSIPNLNAGATEAGFRLSNRPKGVVTNTATTDIRGNQQPDWEVEIYHDGVFVDGLTIGEDGLYEFLNLPLRVGENVFTLVFYGPYGQKREEIKRINLDPGSLNGHQWLYDVSFSQQGLQLYDYLNEDSNPPEEEDYRLHFHLEKSVSQSSTFTFDFAHYSFDDFSEQNFVQPGMRLFALGNMIDFSILKNLEQGQLTNFKLRRTLDKAKKHKISYSFTQESEDFKTEANDFASNQQAHSLAFAGPFFKSKILNLNYSISLGYTQNYEDIETNSLSTSLGGSFYRLAVNTQISRTETRVQGSTPNESWSGKSQLGLNQVTWGARLSQQYKLQPYEATLSTLSLRWRPLNRLNTQTAITYDHPTKTYAKSFGASWQNRYFSTVFRYAWSTPEQYSAYLGIHVAFGYDPLDNSPFISSNYLSATGAVSAKIYHDLNNNGQYDPNEPWVEDAEIWSPQSRRRAKSNDDGSALLTGLTNHRVIDIELNENSLEDPYWMTTQEGFSMLPRPGVVKTVYIPIVTGGEVEGTVRIRKNLLDNAQPTGSVPMVLTAQKTGKTLTTRSSFDGLFLFDKVPPGDYQLQVEQDFLEKYQLQSRADIPVHISPQGGVILGADFDLVKKQAQTNPNDALDTTALKAPHLSDPDSLYLVNLGEFNSEDSALLVASLMRMLVQQQKVQLQSAVEIAVLNVETDEKPYKVNLGPVKGYQEGAKICESMLTEGLTCRLDKIKTEK